MQPIPLRTPLSREDAARLRMGDLVAVSGTIYTARDAAHALMIEALEAGEPLPFDVRDQVIYYAGPTPAPPGRAIGSCGPTTSGRMDAFTPALLDAGLRAMIGKGPRSPEVVEAMRRAGAVYFAAVGGAAALIAECVDAAETIAYPHLGPEAVRKLTVREYPCIVAIDACGNDLYEQGPALFRRS